MTQRNELTERLCALLRGANGDVSWSTVERAAGMPLDRCRGILARARLYLERDEGIVFETLRGKGLRRMSDSAKAASAVTFQRALRRTAGRGTQRIDAADLRNLSRAERTEALLRRRLFEAVARDTATPEPKPKEAAE